MTSIHHPRCCCVAGKIDGYDLGDGYLAYLSDPDCPLHGETDELPSLGWLVLNGLMSLWPLAVLVGLIAGGLALAGALGVG